jgi:hypothetical protein
MMETILEKEYSVNYNTREVKAKLTKKRERFRRSTIVYNFINYIVKNVYLINDDIDDYKKTD